MKRTTNRRDESQAVSPKSTHKTLSRRPRFGGGGLNGLWTRRRLPGLLLLLLLVVGLPVLVCYSVRSGSSVAAPSSTAAPWLPAAQDASGTVKSRNVVNKSELLGTVHSLSELHAFCQATVPQLANSSWSLARNGNVTVATKMVKVKYYIEDVPVCVDDSGRVLVDRERYESGLSVLDRYANFPVYALTDNDFKRDAQQGFAEAVPALGIFAKGRWIDSHIWHLIRDCIGALMTFFMHYNYGEMFTLPTQTVLVRGERGAWVDRYGDTKQKMALSARVLNSFSSPQLGGPFFSTSPMVVIRNPNRKLAQPTNGLLKKPLLQCYCQAMSVNRKKVSGQVDRNVYFGIEDLVARQFGEEGYLKSHSFEETDRRRRASHPWASQFWKEATFDVNGTYRPRALVIHRQSRLIGDVEKYVDHLRKLNFRVEEIFPERLPLEQQYHLGRYADLLVGMHGLGVAHAFWMDRFPLGCRSIVEFRPWVTPGLPVDLHRILGRFMGFDYHYPEPIDVTFGDNVKDHTLARTRLMDNAHLHRAFAFPEFTDQTAYYNETKVFALFDKIRKHLDECLRYAQHVPRFSPATGCGA